MKSLLSSTLRFIGICFLGVLVLQGCKKEDTLVLPQEVAHFTNQTGGTYFVTAPGTSYKIPVGVSTVSSADRTVTITVSSPTGAVAGTQYTLSSTTVTIPAGEAVDTIEVRGDFAAYSAGRKDTLVLTITQPDVKAAPYNSTYTLYMRGPCFEGDVVLEEFLGDYANTNELFGTSAYGPYTTSISSVTQTSPTTGDIVVTNIWDSGWGPITFSLDWTDAANRKVTIAQQSGIADAGTLSATYAGQDVSVRAFAGQVGTFSICGQTLQLKLQLGVTGLGWFGSLYTVNMAR